MYFDNFSIFDSNLAHSLEAFNDCSDHLSKVSFSSKEISQETREYLFNDQYGKMVKVQITTCDFQRLPLDFKGPILFLKQENVSSILIRYLMSEYPRIDINTPKNKQLINEFSLQLATYDDRLKLGYHLVKMSYNNFKDIPDIRLNLSNKLHPDSLFVGIELSTMQLRNTYYWVLTCTPKTIGGISKMKPEELLTYGKVLHLLKQQVRSSIDDKMCAIKCTLGKLSEYDQYCINTAHERHFEILRLTNTANPNDVYIMWDFSK